ncbi:MULTISPECIES: DNA helicase II [Methylococcus]|uniref:DNA 3'-5' helicase n=1 Tax=Methylococcus capsulatus TaxID=414 RepID=A0ABZ2FBX3_METCP|nr:MULTISPECIES: DNA helicase II [Methylococcus]MDF9392145.1 DNA helicase II [Methylococcus capsulatus]
MDITDIIAPLNEAQREAVTAPDRSLLVLAGAGSGKTRVLVHRIAWLLRAEGVSPHAILAVTFTNKAANEMKARIEALLELSTQGLWVGTFHGLAHRFLRRHAPEAGLPEGFQILDSDDQYRLIRRLLKTLELDEARWPPRQIQWYINTQKDEGRRARNLPDSYDPFEQQMRRIYLAYEELCQRSGLVDFAELLLRTHEFLRDNADALAHYQERFQHVLVDEFQDTNSVQYAWLRLLTQDRDNLSVVGDDDQSIYGWRGAKIENLHRFRRDYPRHRMIRLEQNYRSTGNILSAANALIARNEGRLGKNLWTEGGRGEPISVYAAFNEQDESCFVIERIRRWVEEGGRRSDAAILYRSNAQSRQFEEKLLALGIPYRVYGGLRFFERAEIKDALAYLRLIANHHDDPGFERVINTPTRGIGAKTLDLVRELARFEQLSLWAAAEKLIGDGVLPARAAGALAGFLDLVETMAAAAQGRALWEQVELAVKSSGLLEHYRKEKGEQAEARVENLEELVGAARQFELDPLIDPELGGLDQFLAHAALEAGENQGESCEDCVQLMTLHAAKGLEFNLVFLVGLEEGLFPSLQSLEDPARLEEERRLCYVGITRARRKLYITHAECRRLYGKETYPRRSRFLRELPPDCLEEVRMKGGVSRPVASAMQSADTSAMPGAGARGGFRLGQRVRHGKFGEGVILQQEGDGAQARVHVNFAEVGAKWLMLAYANLEPI